MFLKKFQSSTEKLKWSKRYKEKFEDVVEDASREI